MPRDADQQDHAEYEEGAEDGHRDGPPQLLDPLRQADRAREAYAAQRPAYLVAAVRRVAHVLAHRVQRLQQGAEGRLVAHRRVEVVVQGVQVVLHLAPQRQLDLLRLRV